MLLPAPGVQLQHHWPFLQVFSVPPPQGLCGSLCWERSSPTTYIFWHPHFFIHLSSYFPIISLFPPVLSSLVILFKRQPTPFLLCLLLVLFPVFFFCFHSPPFRRCMRACPKVGAQWTFSDLLNFIVPSVHIVGARCFSIDSVKLQIIFCTRKGNTDFYPFHEFFTVNKNWKWLYIRNRCVSSVYSKTLSFKEWKILVVHSRRNYGTNNRFIEPMAMLKYRQCHITRKMLIQMLEGRLWSCLSKEIMKCFSLKVFLTQPQFGNCSQA